MKTATVRDLRQRFNDVVKWVETGEEISVTRRGVAVATLGPPRVGKRQGKVDWERRLQARAAIRPKKSLTAEETAGFYQSLKREF